VGLSYVIVWTVSVVSNQVECARSSERSLLSMARTFPKLGAPKVKMLHPCPFSSLARTICHKPEEVPLSSWVVCIRPCLHCISAGHHCMIL
jgi:hypothetical protein